MQVSAQSEAISPRSRQKNTQVEVSTGILIFPSPGPLDTFHVTYLGDVARGLHLMPSPEPVRGHPGREKVVILAEISVLCRFLTARTPDHARRRTQRDRLGPLESLRTCARSARRCARSLAPSGPHKFGKIPSGAKIRVERTRPRNFSLGLTPNAPDASKGPSSGDS